MNNKGMSLLELVISMAISVIVILMIASFLSAAFRVFRKANDDTKLQMESQTTINQIVNLAMEAKSISVTGSALEERILIDNIDLSGYTNYVLVFRKDLNRLYLYRTMDTDPTLLLFDEDTFNQKYLLAEYVTAFEIEDAGTNAKSKNIIINFGLGRETLNITKKVTLRNAP